MNVIEWILELNFKCQSTSEHSLLNENGLFLIPDWLTRTKLREIYIRMISYEVVYPKANRLGQNSAR